MVSMTVQYKIYNTCYEYAPGNGCCCCCLLQTTLSCQVTDTSIDFRSKYINSVVSVVTSGAQILSKNGKHLYDCR